MKKITKAIIATSGWGTRRLPITKVIEKSMLPIGNRPIIDYIIQDCAKASIKDIYIVIDDKESNQIKAYYEPNAKLARYLITRGKEDKLPLIETKPTGVNMHFLAQTDTDNRYGTAAPIAQAVEKFYISEQVVVLMGDDLLWNTDGSSDLTHLISSVKNETESALLAVEIPREDVAKYGVLSIKDGLLDGLYEKPSVENAPSNFINISKYVMSASLLERVVNFYKSNHFGPRDQEYVITDPIISHIKAQEIIRVLPAVGEYLDCGTLEGWLHANNTVLNS